MNKLAYTVVEGKYHGIGRQYCPSAWLHEEGHGPDLSQTEQSGPDYNLRVIGEFRLTALNYLIPEQEAAERRQKEMERIQQIVKAANAYPKLVEALRVLVQLDPEAVYRLGSQDGERLEPAALLRELGE